MRGKRSKQYRKLMQQYGLHFGFREPYQVIVDAAILQDATRFKMNFSSMLQKTLHGEVKLMITQCSMRHLYEAKPKNETLITHVKNFERRRCNHHELETPNSTLECLKDVVDPKGSRTNKHRYIVATQDPVVRAYLRRIPGVPLIYLKRSVMIMEPMAGSTEAVREREERAKFSLGLKGSRTPGTIKRKREGDHGDEVDAEDSEDEAPADVTAEPLDAKTGATSARKPKRVKGPNPMSVKKKKKRTAPLSASVKRAPTTADATANEDEQKKKRRRRHRGGKENDADATMNDAGPSNETDT